MSRRQHSLFARYVLPMHGPPVHDGVVTIDSARGMIVSLARFRAGDPVTDLGDVVLLPGLVNAHTHLELSDIPHPLGRPGMTLPEWIPLVIAHRIASPILPADRVAKGLIESLGHGVTTVADTVLRDPAAGQVVAYESPRQGEAPAKPGVGNGSGQAGTLDLRLRLSGSLVGDFAWPRMMALLELIAPDEDREQSVLAGAREWLDAVGHRARSEAPEMLREVLPGLSPHAPYSIRPSLLAAAAEMSARRGVPLSMHLAETREELQLLRDGSGPFREMLERLDAWDGWVAANQWPRGPVDYVESLAGADRALVVHGNYLDAASIAALADRRDRMSVVYCPRTHAWFRHEPYPLVEMLRKGVRVVIGTDGLASAPDLSILAEMRHVAGTLPTLDRQTIMRMGTIDAAEALGLGSRCGSIAPERSADLVAMRIPGGVDVSTKTSSESLSRLVLENGLPVCGVWMRGQRVLGDP